MFHHNVTLTWTAPLIYFIAVTLGIVNGTPPHIRSAMSSSGKEKQNITTEKYTGNNDPSEDNDICHEVKQGRLHRLMKLKYCQLYTTLFQSIVNRNIQYG